MSLRLEEKPFELEGKVYTLRCNMAVLDALQEAHDGDFGAVYDLPVREGSAQILAAMLNDYAEDMGWEERWTAKQIKKRLPWAALLELDVIGMFTRATVPGLSEKNAEAPAGETGAQPGDDQGN